MTTKKAEIDECVACGSERITFWEDLSSWVCDDCSYVIDSTGGVAGVGVSTSSGKNEEKEADQGGDWTNQISIKDKSEANLVDILTQTEDLATELSLPNDVAIRAAEIVAEAWKTNFMHGRTKSTVIGAAVYAATRESENTLPPAAISDVTDAKKQSIKRIYKELKTDQSLDIGPPSPDDYVGEICRLVGLSESIQETAENILSEECIKGGNPVAIAGAGVYQASVDEHPDLTLTDIARATGVTKETVWRHKSRIESK
jgi:transcription initiation factor TFIIB